LFVRVTAVCSTRQFILENHLTEEIVEEVSAKVEEIKIEAPPQRSGGRANIKDGKKII